MVILMVPGGANVVKKNWVQKISRECLFKECGSSLDVTTHWHVGDVVAHRRRECDGS